MTDAYEYIKSRLKELSKSDIKPKPLINGDDLIKLGFKPGPSFSKILNKVEELQLEGNLKSKKKAIEYVLEQFSGE